MRAIPLLLAIAGLALAGEDESPSAFRHPTEKKVKANIDLKEVFKGVRKADPRDAIPAIRKPAYLAAEKAAEWLKADDRILGVTIGDESRAYPLKVLAGHELVNDVLGGRPIAPNY
jgi:hypothetical protein